MKKRIQYFDWLEMIAIWFVVFCHDTSTAGTTPQINILIQLTCIAVPIFFLINGTLMFSRKFDAKKHIEKTLWLVVSLFAWKAIYLAVMKIYYGAELDFTLIETFNFFATVKPTKIFMPSSHFWYLHVLITMYLVFPLLYQIYTKAKPVFIFLILASFVIVILNTEVYCWTYDGNGKILSIMHRIHEIKENHFPFIVDDGKYFIYFMLGPVLHEVFYNNKHKKIIIPTSIIVACLSFLLMLRQKFLQEGTLEGDWVRYFNDYQRLSTFILACAVFILFSQTKKTDKMFFKPVMDISIRTMGIYAFHKGLSFFVAIWFLEYLELEPSILVHFEKTFVVFVGSLFVTEILSYIPFVNKVLGLTWNTKKLKKHKKAGISTCLFLLNHIYFFKQFSPWTYS